MGYKLYHTGKLEKVELEAAKVELASLNSQYVTNYNALEIFNNMPELGSPAGKIDLSFANMLRELNISGLDNGVRVASYSILGGGTDMTVGQAAKPLPYGTGVVSAAPVNIRISYTDYEGMKFFVSQLPAKNIQVSSLDINGTQAVISGSFLATLN